MLNVDAVCMPHIVRSPMVNTNEALCFIHSGCIVCTRPPYCQSPRMSCNIRALTFPFIDILSPHWQLIKGGHCGMNAFIAELQIQQVQNTQPMGDNRIWRCREIFGYDIESGDKMSNWAIETLSLTFRGRQNGHAIGQSDVREWVGGLIMGLKTPILLVLCPFDGERAPAKLELWYRCL